MLWNMQSAQIILTTLFLQLFAGVLSHDKFSVIRVFAIFGFFENEI